MSKPTVPQAIRGTQDLFGEEAARFNYVVDTFDRVRRLFGFQRVEMPVFEATAVFARSLGETTDVVSKEMYTFPDRSGESLTLRPEFTAGICRAYLTNGWQQHAPLRVATHGAVFRYERPQKGRFRQFHQLDAEVIGAPDPTIDVELLVVADRLLRDLGITDGVTLQLNTLGDAETRDVWRAALVAHFEAHRGELSSESLERLTRNPLRILDSKDPRDRPIADAAPGIDAYMSSDAGAFFASVTSGLDSAGVKWTRNDRLVRGLDYYRHTAFEFVTDRLGAQGTILAGGRYDGLIEALGGPPTPGVGWAAGIERLAMMLPGYKSRLRTAAIIVESNEQSLINIGEIMLRSLRKTGMPAQIVNTGPVRKRFEKAQKWHPDYLLILQGSDIFNAVGSLRIKRQIFDRFNTRGTIYQSLAGLMANQFSVPRSAFKEAVERGGDITLISGKA